MRSNSGMFQSTLPHGERCGNSHLFKHSRMFQSTLPHGERFKLPEFPVNRFQVSIHAPAWGAISRPTRERDRDGSFNPRSRMGSDDWPKGKRRLYEVSIHAPAWGAIRIVPVEACNLRRFNPRSRMGSDRRAISVGSCPACFNPRSRMGSDNPSLRVFWTPNSFNPRSRMGSDKAMIDYRNDRFPFQSTLPHGERCSWWRHL